MKIVSTFNTKFLDFLVPQKRFKFVGRNPVTGKLGLYFLPVATLFTRDNVFSTKSDDRILCNNTKFTGHYNVIALTDHVYSATAIIDVNKRGTKQKSFVLAFYDHAAFE